MAVIDTAVYGKGRRVDGGLGIDEAVARAREIGGVVWIGLRSPDEAELDHVGELLHLHPLAVLDCLHGHQRAKLEHLGGTTYLVLQPARYLDETETVEFTEIDAFVGADFLVTVHGDDDVIDVASVRKRLEEHPELLEKGPYAGLWAILSELVRDYVPVLEGVENDIDEIEEQLFSRDPGVSERIFKLQREVINLKHATAPLGDMLDRLQTIVKAETKQSEAPAFRDLDDRARHVDDRVSGFKHTLDSALTVDATLADRERNEEMRRLTEFGLKQNDQVKKISSWAAILFAPTLVGTVYGMNFDGMPELHWQFGYPLALTLMLATSVTLYVVFKRRDWL